MAATTAGKWRSRIDSRFRLRRVIRQFQPPERQVGAFASRHFWLRFLPYAHDVAGTLNGDGIR